MSEYTLISSITDTPANTSKDGIYRIIRPSIPFIGFCGYLWQVIRAIYKYPNDKYYIFIGNSSNNNAPNVWEFYFQQPHISTFPPQSEIISEVGILFDESSEFVDLYPCMQKMTTEEIQNRRNEFFSIIQKYFKLLPNLQEKLNNFKEKHFKGKSILGLHYRGTDHPDKPELSTIFPELDLLSKKYDMIFCSSDEFEIIEKLKNRYKNKIITYDSTTRSIFCDFQMPRTDSSEPTHAFKYNTLINWSKENSGYQIGEDIIMEVYLLSSVDFLLCGCNSNVNYFIRAINSHLPYKIIYTPTIQ
jgi:hypothetical protein